MIPACQELPSQELFHFVDEQGETSDVTSSDVNAYLREMSGEDITAKDFRSLTLKDKLKGPPDPWR